MANYDSATDKWTGATNEGTATAREVVGDVANQMKEKVSEFSRMAGRKVDESRGSTAETLQGSADSVRTAGQTSGAAVTQAANKTADTLESTARYVRDHDFGTMMQDLKEVIRRNPTPAIVTGIAIGFLAGSALRSRH